MVLHKFCEGYPLKIGIEIAISLFLLFVSSADASFFIKDGAIVVNSGGDNTDFKSIQDAINAANVGDNIFVLSGTYYENISINKRLTLKGIDVGGGKPVINANGNGSPPILLNAEGSIIDGFIVVTDGYQTTSAGSGFVTSSDRYIPTAGIFVNSNNNTLSNNIAIALNSGYYSQPAGIFVNSNNNTLSNNSASNYEVGIFMNYSNDNTLSGNNFSNNGNGIRLYYSNNSILNENNVSNNGHGIFLYYSSNNLLNENKVSNNFRGIYMLNSSKNTLNNNSANSNNDSGIYLEFSSNNMLRTNNVSSNNKSGISIIYSNNIDIFNNTVNSNNQIAGIFMHDSSNSTLRGNTVNYNIDSGIYMGGNTDNDIIFNNFLNNNYNIAPLDSINVSIDGNVWANPTGSGFSQTCADNDNNEICDLPYTFYGYGYKNYTDLHPLVLKPVVIQAIPTNSPISTTTKESAGFDMIMVLISISAVNIFKKRKI